jgi:hypothetical protein
MEHRTLTKWEQEACRRNLELFQAMFRVCSKKCSNCEFPIEDLQDKFGQPVAPYFSAEAGGSICELCHALEFAIRRQRGLSDAHVAWKQEQEEKKRIIEKDGRNYFR